MPSRPTRRWRKRIGPGEVRRTASAVHASTGESTISSAKCFYAIRFLSMIMKFLSLIKSRSRLLLGDVVGGIASTLPNTNTQADSFPSQYLFKVIVVIPFALKIASISRLGIWGFQEHFLKLAVVLVCLEEDLQMLAEGMWQVYFFFQIQFFLKSAGMRWRL